MNEQELNKKLAGWASVKPEVENRLKTPVELPNGSFLIGATYKEYIFPEFTQSLDDCFKHFSTILMLKGWAIFIEPVLDANFSMIGIKGIFTDKQIWERAEWAEQKEALALCLAIEKMIDKVNP